VFFCYHSSGTATTLFVRDCESFVSASKMFLKSTSIIHIEIDAIEAYKESMSFKNAR